MILSFFSLEQTHQARPSPKNEEPDFLGLQHHHLPRFNHFHGLAGREPVLRHQLRSNSRGGPAQWSQSWRLEKNSTHLLNIPLIQWEIFRIQLMEVR